MGAVHGQPGCCACLTCLPCGWLQSPLPDLSITLSVALKRSACSLVPCVPPIDWDSISVEYSASSTIRVAPTTWLDSYTCEADLIDPPLTVHGWSAEFPEIEIGPSPDDWWVPYGCSRAAYPPVNPRITIRCGCKSGKHDSKLLTSLISGMRDINSIPHWEPGCILVRGGNNVGGGGEYSGSCDPLAQTITGHVVGKTTEIDRLDYTIVWEPS